MLVGVKLVVSHPMHAATFPVPPQEGAPGVYAVWNDGAIKGVVTVVAECKVCWLQTSGPTKLTPALRRQIERMGVLRAGKLLKPA